jgi:hypothetical protein
VKFTAAPSLRPLAASVVFALLAAVSGRAATFLPVQTGPSTWTYNLTFAPYDNYSIFQTVTTITLSGLFGVTAVSGPTSSTFPGDLNTLNLAWTSQILDGGSTVVWSHNGPGTGNFGDPMSVFGFSITAPAATNGLVTFSTSGFARDVGNPLPGGGFNLDISGAFAGPVAVPEPGAGSLVALGLALFGVLRLRRS